MVGDSRYPLNGRDGSLCLSFRTNASICTLFSGHVLPSLVFILESFLERDSKTEHLRRECYSSYSSATFAHSRPSTAISSSCSASALTPVGTSMAAACRQEIVFQEVFHRLGTEAWDGRGVNLLDIPFGEVLFFLHSNVLSAKPVPSRVPWRTL